MKTKTKTQRDLTLAATVSSEDIACGDFVAIFHETIDVPSYLWDGCSNSLPPDEMVRLKLIPSEAGLPIEGDRDLPLPFVYAKSPGGVVTVDIPSNAIGAA